VISFYLFVHYKEAKLMVCVVQVYEKPKLDDPVLVEGLPGIGFVANISALHLIHELDAKLFAEITSSSFQDLAVTTEKGGTRSPINQLYYHKSRDGGRDLIIWYGNTQALTTFGQYELCGRVLDLAQELGCQYIITLGGFKTEQTAKKPQIYCAATDPQTLKTALNLGTKIMVGQIFGIAGITIGLAKLRNLKAFSLLVETTGNYPDAEAARQAVTALTKFLNLKTDLTKLDIATEKTKKTLQAFGIIRQEQEKKKEESPFRWFV
jgi:uncharacterized protein (TIGR00162 family)